MNENFETWDFDEQDFGEEDAGEADFENLIDALLAYAGQFQPANRIKMIDFERYGILVQTAAELKNILAAERSTGEFDIELCDFGSSGSIRAVLDDLTVTDTQKFAAMIAKADNFEIYPRTDGKMQLNVTFQAVLKTVG